MPAIAYDRSELLAQPSRRRVYEHLLLLPGDHFRSIVRSLGMGAGTVRHHLAILVHEGLVVEEKGESRCRYYPREGSVTELKNDIYRQHWEYRDLRHRILLAVRAGGDVRPAAIARAFGISRQLAAYHLSRLEEKGFLQENGRSSPGPSAR